MKKKILIIIIIVISFTNISANSVEDKFIKHGLIDISTVDANIKVDLVNSDSSKNYFRKNFYDGLKKCYLQKEVAEKLKKADSILKKKNGEYSLLIMDGARPREISQKMYDQLKNTPFKAYVANPETGSMHNYGSAVDITIVDKNNKEIDMGPTPFYKNDVELAIMMIKKKLSKLSKEQKSNRKLLRDTITEAGLNYIELEWWHFEGFDKEEIRRKYKIIE